MWKEKLKEREVSGWLPGSSPEYRLDGSVISRGNEHAGKSSLGLRGADFFNSDSHSHVEKFGGKNGVWNSGALGWAGGGDLTVVSRQMVSDWEWMRQSGRRWEGEKVGRKAWAMSGCILGGRGEEPAVAAEQEWLEGRKAGRALQPCRCPRRAAPGDFLFLWFSKRTVTSSQSPFQSHGLESGEWLFLVPLARFYRHQSHWHGDLRARPSG